MHILLKDRIRANPPAWEMKWAIISLRFSKK